MEEDWPLQDEERRFFSECKSRAIQNAILPAAALGVIAGRVLHSRGNSPAQILAAGFGVAGALGSLFAFGGNQGCVREFASAPVYPTAIALRSAIRARDASHPLVVRFDRLHPAHDETQLSAGAVPAVRVSEATLQRLMEVDADSIAAETRRAREEARLRAELARHQSKDPMMQHASEAAAAAPSVAAAARSTSSSSAASTTTQSDRRRSAPSSSSSAAPSPSSPSDGRPPSSFGWGDGDVKRKLIVKRNEFGDEVVEEEEMKPE